MKKSNKLFGTVDQKLLDHSFWDACSDKDFKKYISLLEMDEETLKKYTSHLLDSFNEKKNCSKCDNLDACKNSVIGYCYEAVKDGNLLNFSYVACSKMQEKMKNDAYKKNIELFDMPKDIENANLKDLYKDDKARLPILKYFKEFMSHYKDEDKPKGIYLNGSFGSGKTYLVAALFNELAKKGNKCALIYYPEFLRSLKASFSTDYSDRFDYIKKVDLLLLDDIGAENCSSWSRDEVLGPILQYRMEEHLPTFFTSNLTLEELENALAITNNGADKVKARRIIERIKQLTIPLELISKNRRH